MTTSECAECKGLNGQHSDFCPTWAASVDRNVRASAKAQALGASYGPAGEYSGGPVDYYKVRIEHPTTVGTRPYTAECNDIIEALGMSFADGEQFKAIWRKNAARVLGKMKRGNEAVYDAEKQAFYGNRALVIERHGIGKIRK